jgi:pyruvate formate lyase activating enzyme
MDIYGFEPLTLLDYPGLLASTVFLGSCNFCCPFCQNKDLVLNPKSIPAIPREDILLHLKKRKNILEGVCITGGEPTLSNDLPEFLAELKDLGYLIKLDTNGYRPDILKSLWEKKLIDYVAMDIKTSPSNYHVAAGLSHIHLDRIKESVAFLLNSAIAYEFRTTIVKELHTLDDIDEIGHWIAGCTSYYLQSYKDSSSVIKQGLTCHSKETLESFAARLKPYCSHVELRGI